MPDALVLLDLAQASLLVGVVFVSGMVVGFVGAWALITHAGIEVRHEVWRGGPLFLPEPGDVVKTPSLPEIQMFV